MVLRFWAWLNLYLSHETISFRFKDNNVIDKDLFNYDNVLEIPDVAGLNGSFRCRVVNQFGSEFSTAAELTVLGMYSLYL